MKKNTFICVNLKTQMIVDAMLKYRKHYVGVMVRDGEEHFTFTEVDTSRSTRRCFKAFKGRYVNLSLKSDGTPQPNFKELHMNERFNVNAYVRGVSRELRDALMGLVGKESVE